MNEGVEAVLTTESRKKRRRSGFRFSSRKVLEQSRVKRKTSRASECQFESVKKALLYPGEICGIVHHNCAAGSSSPPCLESVLEHEGAGLKLSIGNAITIEECNQKVSYYYSQVIV